MGCRLHRSIGRQVAAPTGAVGYGLSSIELEFSRPLSILTRLPKTD
ncbi:MAG: hypothetical protein FWB93_05465 [Oscillospiraceae bacterium]|nr:hypothetical protein [Oscillospiraceae bacterium]